jgi:hypothetical protein
MPNGCRITGGAHVDCGRMAKIMALVISDPPPNSWNSFLIGLRAVWVLIDFPSYVSQESMYGPDCLCVWLASALESRRTKSPQKRGPWPWVGTLPPPPRPLISPHSPHGSFLFYPGPDRAGDWPDTSQVRDIQNGMSQRQSRAGWPRQQLALPII